MLPIGPLMIEHRLIERMIKLMRQEMERIRGGKAPDVHFLHAAVDFVRTYADRTHHGKEEDILFRDLAKKELSREDRAAMEELVQEHVWARGQVAALVEAAGRAPVGKGAAGEIAAILDRLTEFYPRHIVKEDKEFFPASMRYFTDGDKAAMIAEEYEFDRRLIHEKYRSVVESLEKGGG